MKYFKKYKNLQNLKQGEELSILKSDFENFEQVVVLEDLVLTKHNRNISYANTEIESPFEIMHQIEGVDFYGYKSSFEALGLHLFQLLFSSKTYMHLKLPRKQSEVKDVFLHIERTVIKNIFLKTTAVTFESYDYFREKLEKFPFSGKEFSERKLLEENCPVFLYGWSDHQKGYEVDRITKADQLIISVTIDGLCALATLFLDLASEENDSDEICLEHPTLGFGGTGINSLEARFWLPDSFGFYCENLDDLRL